MSTIAEVEFDNVTVEFEGNRDAARRTAIAETSFKVGVGEFVAVVGPTGCGKSTLLNVAAGLIAPDRGSVSVQGAPLRGRNARAGYMFQADALMPWRTAAENIAVGLQFAGRSRLAIAQQVAFWLERVGLVDAARLYPHEMSGGMRKRVALAQMLVLDPTLLLMDEPFSALDVQTRGLMANELLELWSSNRKSVVFITHDLEEAIALADRVIVMAAGPGSRPLGDFAIDIPRPRHAVEVRHHARFNELHAELWHVLKHEVMRTYERPAHR